MNVSALYFTVTPPGTPLSARQRLSEAVASTLASAEVMEAFAKIGAKAVPATPEQLAVYLAQQQLRWAKIVEAIGISVDE